MRDPRSTSPSADGRTTSAATAFRARRTVVPSAEDIRAAQRATWAALSAGWEKWDAVIMDQMAPVTASIVDAIHVQDAQQHLDVAAGTGEPGLTIAGLARRGRVVLTDLAPEMLDVASRRARDAGLDNVETRVAGADDLPFDDETFDSVSVRFGYMFFPDIAGAVAEHVRVLKSGGRLCASVWIEPDRNPWTTLLMEAVATEVELPPPDPDAPSMYRCAAPGAVRALYERAGLRDVDEWDVPVELVTRSPEEYWDVMSEHVSLAAAALARVDAAARDRMRAAAIEKVRPFERNGSVRVPGLARCLVGTK